MNKPKTQNGPGGVAAPARARNDHKAAEDTSTIARTSDKRKFVGQLPIVRSATAYPPAWGTVTTLVVLDQPCECGDWHNHRLRGNAPALVWRTARCGAKYELALHAPRATRRGKRAA
jgi:hypothetical protein